MDWNKSTIAFKSRFASVSDCAENVFFVYNNADLWLQHHAWIKWCWFEAWWHECSIRHQLRTTKLIANIPTDSSTVVYKPDRVGIGFRDDCQWWSCNEWKVSTRWRSTQGFRLLDTLVLFLFFYFQNISATQLSFFLKFTSCFNDEPFDESTRFS